MRFWIVVIAAGITLSLALVATTLSQRPEILVWNGSAWVPSGSPAPALIPSSGEPGIVAAGFLQFREQKQATHIFAHPIPRGVVCQVQPVMLVGSEGKYNTSWTQEAITVSLEGGPGTGTFGYICTTPVN